MTHNVSLFTRNHNVTLGRRNRNAIPCRTNHNVIFYGRNHNAILCKRRMVLFGRLRLRVEFALGLTLPIFLQRISFSFYYRNLHCDSSAIQSSVKGITIQSFVERITIYVLLTVLHSDLPLRICRIDLS